MIQSDALLPLLEDDHLLVEKGGGCANQVTREGVMGKIGKLLAGIIGVVVVVMVGLTLFVKFYVTEEKVRALVVPQAEKALGRTVTLGAIHVGLLSGISIDGFSVKELDGKRDFLSAKEFVIAYKLLPLLQKEIVVSEIKLVGPQVTVSRDKKGRFNFQNLKVLAEKKDQGEKAETPVEVKAVVLPLALTVDTIKIEQARLSFADAMGQIPDLNAVADLEVAVKLGSTLDSLTYAGKLALKGDAKYGEITPSFDVDADFDTSVLNYRANVQVGKERMHISGKVADYRKSPQVTLVIISEQLNLEYLAGLGAALPQVDAGKKQQTVASSAKAGRKVAIAESLPPGLTVDGSVSVAKGVYKKLAIDNFLLKFDLRNGVLTVKDLQAKTAGGTVASTMMVDLTKPDLAYDGTMSAKALDVTTVGNGLGQAFANMVSGTLQSTLSFAGSGMDAESIKKALTADVDYSLLDGQVTNTELTDTIASVLKVPELKTIAFKDISGVLKVLKGGMVEINTGINGPDVTASTKGTFDLDGNLNLPVNVTLPKALLDKVDTKGGIGQFLASDDGSLNMVLNVGGNYLKPKVTIDQSSVQKQVKKAVANKVIQEVERSLMKSNATDGATPSPEVEQVKGLLRGLFGQ